MYARARCVVTALLVLLFSVSSAFAQQDAQVRMPFAQHQLDQMLAPIALYPDALLSQILMACTYPGEVVEAARWSRGNPDFAGDRAVRAAERMDWDPSVISLVAFPQILGMLDEKREWTEDLGDAFLDQRAQVMDTVQYLRQKAYSAGNLRSSEQVRVDYEGSTFAITLANPEIVYLPYYNPTVVYGTWWWAAYQPVYWAPWPGYYSRPGYARGFAWGTGIPVSRGFFFGAPDWHRRSVNIVNVNNYYYRPVYVNRQTEITRNVNIVHGGSNVWQHDTAHRRDVPYRHASWREQSSHAGATPAARPDTRGNEPAVVDGPGRSGHRDDAHVDAGNRRAERGRPQPVAAGPGTRPHTAPAPAGVTVPAGAIQPAARSAPTTASVPATVSRPNIEQRTNPATAPDGGSRDPEARSHAARGHDAAHGEGRGWSGSRPDGHVDAGSRSEERGRHVVASAVAAQNVGRAPASVNPPAIVNAPDIRNVPAHAAAPVPVTRPNVVPQPSIAPQPSAANPAAGGGRRTEPRNAGAREHGGHQVTAAVDTSVTAAAPSGSAPAAQVAGNPRGGGGNSRHPQ